MHASRVWQRQSHVLATATERDFERKTLPFLKLFWPSLEQTPPRQHWDSKGIDLCVWADRGPFPCIVQCKGFDVQKLDNSQIYQAEESINKFISSGYSCDTYILVHNRDGRYKEFNQRVSHKLKELVKLGKAKRAELWNRQTLLNNAFDRAKQIIEAALHEHSIRLLTHFQNLFKFGYIYISEVPIIEDKLIFKRGEPCSIEPFHSLATRNISEVLLSSREARWALLTGQFGTGKTTTVLHAATSGKKTVIFQSCAYMASSYFHSTNELLEYIVKSHNIFSDFEGQNYELLCELAGPVLGYLLKKPSSPFTLILDGLDENRAFSDYEGLQQLSNQLADLACHIIMTTREEHLNTLFGNFSSAFYEFSAKKGPYRHAQLFRLIQWNEEQVRKFVNMVLNEAGRDSKNRISEFQTILNNRKYIYLYGELPFNPLFLQFILEDIVHYGVRRANRSLLLRSWVEQKIRRDWKVPRMKINDAIDIEDFVARMIMLMENVANLMTFKVGKSRQLAECLPSHYVKDEAEKLFRVSADPILAILLSSVLVPQSIRKGSSINVCFAFRIFQEFFLASYLIREKLPDYGYPNAVKSFYSELEPNRVSN